MKIKHLSMLLAVITMICLLKSVVAQEDVAGEKAVVADTASAQAMGFEKEGVWLTAPLEALKVVPEKWLWCNKNIIKEGIGYKPQKITDIAAGAKLSVDNVTQGKSSLYWKAHTTYPTLHSLAVKGDWSGSKGLALDIFSEKNTGEVVILAVLSDSPETKWKDYYYFPLKINWSGEKTINIPFSAFVPYNSPAGWDKVGGLYFFTKMFGCEPNPYTGLYLDNLRLLDAQTAENTDYAGYMAQLPGDRTGIAGKGYFIACEYVNWQQDQMNHDFPETFNDETVYAPYSYQPYNQAERALFGYYPKFAPGYISFDTKGKAYVYNGYSVQRKNSSGKWESSDITAPVAKWAQAQGWPGVKLKWSAYSSEKAVRFDKDGDIYVIIFAQPIDPANLKKRGDWKKRSALLLHSTSAMKDWQVYQLPGRLAEFEKIDGNNQECLERPPLILLGDYKYFEQADQGGYLLVTEKNSDGSLKFHDKVEFSKSCIGVAQHSGGGNQVITKNGKAYIVYSWLVNPKKWKEGEAPQSPPIPQDHPGLKQSFFYAHVADKILYSKNGVATFVVAYDLKSGKLSDAVYVGSGGGRADDHNWAAITVDGEGYLHVVINGHHNPVNYVHTVKPLDITEWTMPEYVMAGTKEPNVSYATFNCDKAGNLYTLHRSTKGIYNNHLGLYVKPKGQPWQPQKTLVMPWRIMYRVWGHKMMYNPATDRLCLTYFSQSPMKQILRDQYEFDIYYWPEREKKYYTSQPQHVGTPTIPPVADKVFKCSMVTSPATEITSLMLGSDQRWKLATSKELE